LIHVDLMDPITQSIYGNKFILEILEDYSRFNWVIFLTDKFNEWLRRTPNIIKQKSKIHQK